MTGDLYRYDATRAPQQLKQRAAQDGLTHNAS